MGAPTDPNALVGKFVSVDVQPNSVMQVSWIYNDLNSAQAAVATIPPLDIHKGFVAVALPVLASSGPLSVDAITVGGFLHDDDASEYAYGPTQGLPDSKVGTFTQALYDEAKKDGWTVISMKNDWRRIFAFE